MPTTDHTTLLNMAAAARAFCVVRGFNTSFCFFADMRLPSGAMRFYVYDFQQQAVLNAGLVAHGRCNQDWLTGRKFANTIGGGCTSLGRYKIGHAYKGRFGLAYKLYGLDSSNSNAYNRFVVLHAHSCVPAQAVDPSPICQSDGCPTLAPSFLKTVAAKIDSSRQPVLLWIFE
ncbi:MAG TPA: murein L,D-transpeptidase catalytic domain family protein [Chitinophagaceae bacterium]|nr:murein L,D-transpeptidase catalytic domain family protein [Chitinophagaceae bacterium]